MKKRYIQFDNPPKIISASSVVGRKENEGIFHGKYDIVDETDSFSQDTFEKSESEMQRLAVKKALEKADLTDGDIDALFAGDLTNQCVSSNYGLLNYDIPFFGLYGACSTAAEGIMLSSLMVGYGIFEKAIAVTSSHNCSAERQFRYPLEYGGQHTPTSQWTVTGSGAFVISKNGNGPSVVGCMPGKTIDRGITDINNMGAAMAPSAIDTLSCFFKETDTRPKDYDLIVTGDLGYEGHRIVKELMYENGYDMGTQYKDCGLMIYDRKKQDMHSGGSGCGCSAVVFAAHIYEELCNGKLGNVLFLGTGALMSPTSVQQGLSIPGIAHLIHIKGCDK
ncbi:MAG: stage V sporulation protein AD [Clostridia bacterium]|nr:stage V sporulation protein AD [Clostridia bacterium]